LKLDPALRPGLCALTPDLRLTDVRTASGAHPGGNPLGLAPDPNGNLWFTDDASPAIGLYDLAGGKITYPQNGGLRPDSVPRFIVADTNGTIWFTDAGATPAIGMIDPRAKTIVEYNLQPGSVPWNPAYDPVHDLVWFTDQRKPTGAIGVFDPKTKAITEYTRGLIPGSHPEGLVVDVRGNVWFTDDNGPSPAIGMLDGATHEIHEYSSGLVAGSLPRGITIDPAGNVWFADERTVDNSKPNAPGDGLIGMISTTDPKHRIVEYAVAANGGNTHSIPEGVTWYRGYVWFTDDGATKAIGRIDPTTGAVTESSKNLVPDSQPIGIVVVNNVLWFTDRLKNAPKIGRLEAKPSC
jgi:streptogramin lyase